MFCFPSTNPFSLGGTPQARGGQQPRPQGHPRVGPAPARGGSPRPPPTPIKSLCHIPNFGPIKISLSKTKLGFDFGSSDLGTSILSYIPKNPKVLKMCVFSFNAKRA